MSLKSVQPGTRGHTTHRVGDPLPAVLVLSDLARLLGIGRSQAWELEQRGEFRALECARIGNKTRYSGKKVQVWLDGESETTGAATSRATQERKLPRHPHHDRRVKGASLYGSHHHTKDDGDAHA